MATSWIIFTKLEFLILIYSCKVWDVKFLENPHQTRLFTTVYGCRGRHMNFLKNSHQTRLFTTVYGCRGRHMNFLKNSHQTRQLTTTFCNKRIWVRLLVKPQHTRLNFTVIWTPQKVFNKNSIYDIFYTGYWGNNLLYMAQQLYAL